MKNFAGCKNLYVDCSSAMPFLGEEKSKELVKFYGADHIIFGTDFPMWDIGEELNRFNKLGLTDEEKELVLYKNACKLFKINEVKIIEKFKNK